MTDQLPSRPATQLQIFIILFSRKTARYNRQISFGCLPPGSQLWMSTPQEEDRIEPAIQPQISSPQVDGQSQPQTAYPIYPPPDALPETATVPVPIRDPVYVTPLEYLGESPADIDCPFCHRRTRTRVNHAGSNLTNIATMICFLGTCVCFWVPSWCGWCENTDQYCSECNRQVTHKPHDDNRVQVISPAPRRVPSKYPVEQVIKGMKMCCIETLTQLDSLENTLDLYLYRERAIIWWRNSSIDDDDDDNFN